MLQLMVSLRNWLMLHLLLLEQQRLRIEHVEVIGEAALISDHRDVVGLLRRGHRLGGEALLLVHRLAADQLIGDVLQRIHQRLVVMRHGDVVTGGGLTQL